LTHDLALPPPEGRLRQSVRALRHRNFRLLWAGQLARGIGSWMQNVAMPLLIVSLGGSAPELGILAAVQFGPVLVLAPVGGVLADRLPKRRLIIGLQVLSALQAAALTAIVITGRAEVWSVLALAAVFGVVNSAEMPVRWAYVAELVDREDLPNAIALHSAAFNTTRVVGPAVAGMLIAFVSTSSAFACAAAAAVLTAAMITAIDPRRVRRSDSAPEASVARSLTDGLRYAYREPLMRDSLMTLGVVSTLAMSFLALLPIYAVDLLGMDSLGYGALLTGMGIGAVLASIPMSIATLTCAHRLLVGVPLVLALAVGLLTVVRVSWLAVLVMGVIGFFFMVAVSSINMTIQHGAVGAIRGRMVGLYIATLHGGTAVGGLAIGALADTIGITPAMAAAAMTSAIFGALTGRGIAKRPITDRLVAKGLNVPRSR